MFIKMLSLKQYGIFLLVAILLFACSTEGFDAQLTASLSVESPQSAEVPFVRVTPDPDRPIIGSADDRMAGPVLSADPSQADLGAEEYWLRCMACHGDRGQGLTDEWRAAWGPEHMDCWQSKCHASNHPPEGFELLPYAPNIINPNAFARFQNAQEYYDYIATQMPWWNPGSLDEEMNWQITAFLLRENGVKLPAELNSSNATSIILSNP